MVPSQILFAFSMNQFYNWTNGTENHFHIILWLAKTGLQAIGYHENEAKMPWYWIGTKKRLNDMEWVRKLKLTIQICIEKEWDIRKSTMNFASLSSRRWIASSMWC